MRTKRVVPILNVSSLEATVAWFEKLGSSEIFLCLNGQGGRGLSGLPVTFGPGSDIARERASWISVFVDDLDAVHRRAVEQGLEITFPPTDMSWNLREMHVRHPDGHVLRIGQEFEESNSDS